MERGRSSPPSSIVAAAAGLLCLSCVGLAQEAAPAAEISSSDTVALPEFVLAENRVANQVPASSYATPVSFLRFEPQIDLQTRNFGEAQGDIAIRGGIFEGTAVQIGGLTVFDPQTGHYAAELPVPSGMLAAPTIQTGADHAFGSMQAAVGTVGYAWRRIEAGGEASLAFGSGDLNRQSIYAGEVVVDDPERDRHVAVDASWARSEADGTVEHGDHEFQRVAARIQVTSGFGETELFGGYQDKFFGWPNLYTPFGVAETEHLETTLLMLSHRQQVGDGSIEAGLHYRRNKDDYEFDRFRPGLFNPYRHETDAGGGFVHYRAGFGVWRVEMRGEAVADALESTALTYGRFMSRSYWKLAAAAERDFESEAGWITTRLGATVDDTNRDGSAVSPVARVSWTPTGEIGGATPRVYVEYSAATRVPGYTALNSSPAGGLFRGNADLGRETSRNAEIGSELRGQAWSARLALFVRHDDPMVDWTFTAAAPNARTAREVEIDMTGLEVIGSRTFGSFDLVASYAYLHKDADYGAALVDASFYALNFPEHRATLAVIARLGGGLELRCDNEYRMQEENLLRTIGGDEAFLTSLGLVWVIPHYDSVELSLVVDNLWDDDFQELPAVPAAGRQVTAGVTWRW
ncbi:MAG: TonB-dependent receptor [Opitutaceae bacterium]|nr:TonB-dependent receptor [Opitutaceae bacterium]